MGHIVIIGLNHRTAPVEIRERLAFPTEAIGHALRSLLERESLKEGVILSTCNRVEICALARQGSQGTSEAKEFMAAYHGIPLGELNGYLYHYEKDEAVKHLFRVASSLDSMVLGEPQILGQVKDAYGYAAEFRTIGPVLNKFFAKTFSVAKRVRTETKVASSAVSVSYAAVELARKIFGDLSDKTVLLVGAGEMCELAARHLISAGVKGIMVTNRTFERAVKLAEEFGGIPIRFDEISVHLKRADIVLSSTGASHFILRRQDIEEVLRIRKNRPMFFIDMAVPRDIDPDANQVDNVYVYDIDDLNNVIETNLEERQREALKAEEIVTEEVRSFRRWLDAQQSTPTIINLRRKYEEVKNTEVAKAMSMLGTEDPKMRKVVESLASSLLNKILHAPISSLKKNADGGNQMDLVSMVREIFDLSEGSERAGTGDADDPGETPQE
ncbi:MAG TPA: glutamyl-tRNA reductase [Candidatus Limnocylindria bacterium]|nr:glutamyl-tRNA reductase [Candidatus Limnocylindria bacterium]